MDATINSLLPKPPHQTLFFFFFFLCWLEPEEALLVLAMAATHFLRLLIIFWGFVNLLLCSNAVPTSRSFSLMNGSDQFLQVSSNTHMVSAPEVEVMHGRMVVELNDYPGSGANNRHTPRPQFRGCADC